MVFDWDYYIVDRYLEEPPHEELDKKYRWNIPQAKTPKKFRLI